MVDDNYKRKLKDDDSLNFSWSAVSKVLPPSNGGGFFNSGLDNFLSSKVEFAGRNLEGGKFAKENLNFANFSSANLKKVDFSGASLKGVDFSGADLTGANLSGADLEGAVFDGAVLREVDFTGAKLKHVKLIGVDIEDVILLDVSMDPFTVEQLQELIEYIIKNHPHKLNLSRINLTGLDLKRIDLSKLNLRGVDFRGCDFTGVNIFDLDLSECIITPEQIAQALGKVPNEDEIKKLMAPKSKAGSRKSALSEIAEIFKDDGKEIGVIDTLKGGVMVADMLKFGKKVFRQNAERPEAKEVNSEEKKETVRDERPNDKEELRKKLEEYKREELEKIKQRKQEMQRQAKILALSQTRGRDGY